VLCSCYLILVLFWFHFGLFYDDHYYFSVHLNKRSTELLVLKIITRISVCLKIIMTELQELFINIVYLIYNFYVLRDLHDHFDQEFWQKKKKNDQEFLNKLPLEFYILFNKNYISVPLRNPTSFFWKSFNLCFYLIIW